MFTDYPLSQAPSLHLSLTPGDGLLSPPPHMALTPALTLTNGGASLAGDEGGHVLRDVEQNADVAVASAGADVAHGDREHADIDMFHGEADAEGGADKENLDSAARAATGKGKGAATSAAVAWPADAEQLIELGAAEGDGDDAAGGAAGKKCCQFVAYYGTL